VFVQINDTEFVNLSHVFRVVCQRDGGVTLFFATVNVTVSKGPYADAIMTLIRKPVLN
jgi:hypothetical protein